MQLDKNMLSRLLTMNDAQLASFVASLAKDSGIDPQALGINPTALRQLRATLTGATDQDLERFQALYRDFNQGKIQKP